MKSTETPPDPPGWLKVGLVTLSAGNSGAMGGPTRCWGWEPVPCPWKLIDSVLEAIHTFVMTQQFQAWVVCDRNVCFCIPKAVFENVHCSFTCRKQK